MATTYYVGSVSRADYQGYALMTLGNREVAERADRVRALWAVDGVDTSNDAIAALMVDLSGQWLGSDITVTRIIPRPQTNEERLDAARSQLRADYWNDVRGVVDDIKRDIERRNVTTEDEVTEYIDVACDGHARVIYTGRAIEGLLYTDNEDAHTSEYDEAPLDESGNIKWSALMYCAFRQDVLDTLGDIAQLLEDAAPDVCEDCGEELPADTEG